MDGDAGQPRTDFRGSLSCGPDSCSLLIPFMGDAVGGEGPGYINPTQVCFGPIHLPP